MSVQESSLIIEDQNTSPERNVLVEYLRRWGGSAANAVLDLQCKMFTTPEVQGLISYRNESKCIVTYGDPVCDPKDIPILTIAFHQYCKQLGKEVVYIGTSKAFMQWAMQHTCSTAIEFGAELFINPQDNQINRKGSNGLLLRGKMRQAERAGVLIKEFNGNDINIQKQIEQVAQEWLAARKGPQVYIAEINLFDDRFGKRWLYATQNDKIIGLVMLSLMVEHKGWLLDRLLTSNAPNGTSELLAATALDILENEGCQYVTFGPTPLPQLGTVEGLGTISEWIARKGYLLAYYFLNLSGRRKFWEKYHPQGQPCYLLFSRKGIGLKELSGLIEALNISL